jgi:citrate synthase
VNGLEGAVAFDSVFTCARTAGCSAHILEQKREGRLIRPTAAYVGEPPRKMAGGAARP